MPDRPTALELLEAVNEFLAGEVLPLMDDHRMKFRTLVALNALGIAYRELAAGEDGRPLRPDDVPLTEEGIEQARAAGEALVSVRFDRVVTSGLPRTEETARI